MALRQCSGSWNPSHGGEEERAGQGLSAKVLRRDGAQGVVSGGADVPREPLSGSKVALLDLNAFAEGVAVVTGPNLDVFTRVAGHLLDEFGHRVSRALHR